MSNEKIKNLLTTVIVATLTSVITANATSYLYSSKDVSFDKGNTTITSDNVQGAVQELYEAATDYSGLDTRIATLESDKQDKITGGATTIISNNLTASRALISNGSGKVAVSGTTSTELGYVSGVTSAIQTQLNAKAALASPTFTGTPKAPTASAGTNTTQLATTAFTTTAVSDRIKVTGKWGTTLTVQVTGMQTLCFIDLQPYLILTVGSSGSTSLSIKHLGSNTDYSGTGSVTISGIGTFTRDSSNNLKFTRPSGGSNVAITFWYKS